ncbi:MAG: flagellar assembly protein FliH [Rhodospirillaceae bacterium]
MTSIRKFQFDISFDTDAPSVSRQKEIASAKLAKPAEPPPPPPPPPPPTFSEAELAQAQRKAYADGEKVGQKIGFERGRGEAEAKIQAILADAMTRLADGIELMVADREDMNAARTGQPLKIAMAVLDRLLPGLLKRHGPAELEEFITACLNEAIDEPRLTVRTHPEILDEVRTRIDEMAAARGFTGRVVMLADATLGQSDARIDWADGGAERNTERLLTDIQRVADDMLGEEK